MNYHSQRQRYRRKPISEINVVPYIDVTLVLLIIFMMTAPLQQSAIDVDLPESQGAKITAQEQFQIIVSIQKNGKYFLSEKQDSTEPIALTELLTKVTDLQKHHPQMQVYLRADKAIDYGKVISVMAALKEAGILQVGLMTSPAAEP